MLSGTIFLLCSLCCPTFCLYKDEEKLVKSSESPDLQSSRLKSEAESHSQRSTPDPMATSLTREDNDARGDSNDGDDKKRKRKVKRMDSSQPGYQICL